MNSQLSAALILAMSSLSFVSGAQEIPPQKFKEWQFQRTTLSQLSLGETCIASTSKIVGADTWTLLVLASPTKAFPTSLALTTSSLENLTHVPLQTDSSSTSHGFFKFEAVNGLGAPNAIGFMYAPKALSSLYSNIRKDNQVKLSVKVGDKVQKIYLSLSGSTAALDQVSKLCAGGKDFVWSELYKYLEAVKLEPGFLAPEKGMAAMWSNLNIVWKSYAQTGVLSAGLKLVQSKIDPLVKQQQDFLRRNGLLSKQIKEKDAQKLSLEQTLSTLISQKAALEAQVKQNEVQLEKAREVFRVKEEAFRPVAEEGRPIFDAYEAAQDRVSSFENAISNGYSEISSLESKIQSLQDDLRSLQNQIVNEDRNLSAVRNERVQAQSELNRFNFDFEMRQRVANDFNIRNMISTQESLRSEIQRTRQDLRQERQKREELERDLRRCQNTPNSDCSSLISNLNQSESSIRTYEDRIQDKETDIRNIEAQIDQRKMAIERDVKAIQDSLADRVEDLDRKVANHENRVRELQSRQAAIRNIEIPESQNRISSLHGSIASWQAQLPAAEAKAFEAKKALDLFLARTDYYAKKNAFEAARSEVRKYTDLIASDTAKIAQLAASISKNQSALAKVKSELEALIAEATQGEESLRGVEAQLLGLNAEKQKLSLELATEQAILRDSTLKVKAILKDLEDTSPKISQVLTKEKPLFHEWAQF